MLGKGYLMQCRLPPAEATKLRYHEKERGLEIFPSSVIINRTTWEPDGNLTSVLQNPQNKGERVYNNNSR